MLQLKFCGTSSLPPHYNRDMFKQDKFSLVVNMDHFIYLSSFFFFIPYTVVFVNYHPSFPACSPIVLFSSLDPCLLPFCQSSWLIECSETGISGRVHAQGSIDWSRMTMGDMKNDAASASLAPMALYTVMFPVFKEVKNKKKEKKKKKRVCDLRRKLEWDFR